jgi:hypothetical protein
MDVDGGLAVRPFVRALGAPLAGVGAVAGVTTTGLVMLRPPTAHLAPVAVGLPGARSPAPAAPNARGDGPTWARP